MRKARIALLVGSLSLLGGCENFLDVNENPNAPEEVAANTYLPPMLHWMVTAPQFDGLFIGEYTQQWTLPGTSLNNWARMGYIPGSDAGSWQWRVIYWNYGQNLVDMMRKAEAEQRWDVLGVGYILKAWGWQALTDLHGEIIVREAFDVTKSTFNYDDQQFVYQEVQRLLGEAIKNLQRTDGAVDPAYLARGDKIYNGNRQQWLKFAHGLLAMNLNHYTPIKSTYDPAAVIAAVDRSFTSNADDALLTYPATHNDAMNFSGQTRNNITNYRQTQFVVNLMNGTQFGGVVDPRMTRMLSASPDGQYRGLDPNIVGFGALTTSQRPNNFFGYPGTERLGQPGKYVFDDKARMPAMTHSQLQFIKAEAAYRMGNKPLALAAYRNAISAHIDFVNARNSEAGLALPPISAAEKAAFLANPAIVPTAANLTLAHIMSQKYIAQWAWGHNELWMDMRRYHYTDVDPASGRQVYPGFSPPTNLYADNAGGLVYRLRPRYNSEYVWNRAGLQAIGGLAENYHTKQLWIVQP
ncbi:MAG: SusD/RagB family nutrient-binding outer membrane lipoprotein [Gemmatimonadota bacterium]|nr:SusD/RagB family nutrient-binding outer membrane lipoprotein [Gemmatimonadota bacterium]